MKHTYPTKPGKQSSTDSGWETDRVSTARRPFTILKEDGGPGA